MTRPSAAVLVLLLAGCGAKPPPVPPPVDYSSIKVWRTFPLHERQEPTALVLSPDGTRLYAVLKTTQHVSQTKVISTTTLAAWDLEAGTGTFRDGTDPNMTPIAYAAGIDILVTPGSLVGPNTRRGALVLHDARDITKERATLREPPAGVVHFAVRPDGRQVAAVLDDGRMAAWELDRGMGDGLIGGGLEVWDGPFNGHPVYSPDGSRILCGGAKGKLRLVKSSSGRLVKEYETHDGYPLPAFAPDGKAFAIGDALRGEGKVRIYSLPGGWEERALGVVEEFFAGIASMGKQEVGAVRYTPDGRCLVTPGPRWEHEGVLVLRDVQTGQPVPFVPARGQVTFSADGRVVAARTARTEVTVWRAEGP